MISGVDLHFEMHSIPYLENLGIIPEYKEYMKFKGDKLILSSAHPDYPEAQVYPIKEICDHFNTKYFNNTIAYMVALAIVRNPDLEELTLFGIDMAATTEYAHQRPCLEYYLGWASAKGIKLIIPRVCPILKTTHLYGVEEAPAWIEVARKRKKELEAAAAKYLHQRDVALINDAYTRGCRDENKIMGQLFP